MYTSTSTTTLDDLGRTLFSRYDQWTFEQKKKFLEAIQKKTGTNVTDILEDVVEEERKKEDDSQSLMDELKKLI
jgi:molybdenum-dependent DNA-binding transcriptional regulator ModE